MALFEDVQKIALLSVLRPDYNAWMRKVCRWYSRTFKTPLHEVEDLPVTYVLQHYWETVYDEMENPEKLSQIMELIESPEDKKKRVEKEKTEEDEFMEMMQREMEDKTLNRKGVLKKAIKGIEKLAMKPPKPPDDIELRFIDEDQLNDLMNAVDEKGNNKK